MKIIHSDIFGPSRESTAEERDEVALLVKTVPICVFQELNKRVREIGLTFLITGKDEYKFFGAHIDYNNGVSVYLRDPEDIKNNEEHADDNERITYLYTGPKPCL